MDQVLSNKWYSLTLPQQMVNIGNEVKRAMKVKSDQDKKNAFLEKALKYTHLSMNDPKNEKVIPELKIGEDVLSHILENNDLACTEEQIVRYYQNFALFI